MVRSPVGSLVRHVHSLVRDDAPDAELLRRFVASREHEAFAALVRRHGRLVWGVCRHALDREHDAEDAFQAVFLVLARKAASIRHGESVGGWLYGVAYRVARKAKALAARRLDRERRAAVPEAVPEKDLAWRELQAILDDELVRLPEKYRVPFVLCCLEGRSREEAEAELGWKRGTVSSRIAQARRLLEQRLARRGVTLSAALTTAALWQRTAAAMPAVGDASAAAVALANGFVGGSAMRLLLGAFVVVVGMTAASLSGPPARPAVAEAPTAPSGVDLSGDPLPPGAVARLGTTRFRHGDWIRSIEFTPDGKRVVSHGSDGVRVWDAATGREVGQMLSSASSRVTAAALSPDGRTVVTSEFATLNTKVRVRDLETFRALREFRVDNIQRQRLSPDGKHLAGTVQKHSKSYFMELWEVETGKQLHAWEAHQHAIWCHDFTPDGKHVVTGGEGVVRFWDVKTAAKAREIAGIPGTISSLAVSPDGATLATIGMAEKKAGAVTYYSRGGVVRVYDIASGKETRQLQLPEAKTPYGEPASFSGLKFAPDGKTLVTLSTDGFLRHWDAATWKERQRFAQGSIGANTLAFSRDGKTLALGFNSVRLLDFATGEDAAKLFGGGVSTGQPQLTPDGRTVAALSETSVILWDAATGRPRGRVGGPEDGLGFLRLLEGGRSLVGVDRHKNLRVWNLKSGKETSRVALKTKANNPLVAVSADGKAAAVRCEKPNELALVDLASGEEAWRLPVGDGYFMGAAFSPDGDSLVLWTIDHEVHVWDLKARKKRLRFEFYDSPTKKPRPVPVGGRPGRGSLSYGAHLSPDGSQIVYGSQDNYLALHEVATGKLVRAVEKLPDGPCVFAFAPDGRTLAWGGWTESPIRFLEVATGQERHKLDGHKGRVYSLSFAADCSTLVSSSADGVGLVWDLFGRSEPKSPLAAKDLDACWADLLGDAPKAFGAMRRLLKSPEEAGPYLARRVRRVPEPDAKQVAAWLADLGSDSFENRKAATAALEKLGELAAEPCRRALENHASLEARKRLEKLLATFDAEERDLSPERLRALRAVEVLERIGTPAARRALEDLAAGASGSRLTREAKAALGRAAPGGGA